MTPSEAEFAALAASEGWRVTKRGWPDFICRRDGQLMAVEVKSGSDGLSHEQWECINDLRAAGIPTFLWTRETGYQEIGAPVTESIHSLKATIADLRRMLAERPLPEKPEIASEYVMEWMPSLTDYEGLKALARECRRSHSDHAEAPHGEDPMGVCVWVVKTIGDDPDKAIGTNMERWLPTYYRGRRRVEEHQHGKVHQDMHRLARCTFCDVAEAA